MIINMLPWNHTLIVQNLFNISGYLLLACKNNAIIHKHKKKNLGSLFVDLNTNALFRLGGHEVNVST